ncbi:MAG TPA: FtsX-like permease family protein [Dehalococcoidia bacterium]|nr:FtsX-like permease family protein [Dehalococcoidia bacterium]
MDELFGLSMNLIMYVLVCALAVALTAVGLIAWRNPVMFKIGVRNIPRRRAQTTLIVLGLMLSTLIISAAFTTGDTVDQSITQQVFSRLGSVDQVVRLQSAPGDESIEDEEGEEAIRDPSFDLAAVMPLIEALSRDERVDAVVPVYADVAAAVNLEKRLSSPVFTLTGIDPVRFGDLPDLKDTRSGAHLKVSDLAAGEIYLNKSAADELDVRAGDSVQITVLGKARTFRVRAVVEDKRLAGSAGISTRLQGGVVPLAIAQEMFSAPGKVTYIAISNQGDARGGLRYAEEVAADTRALARSAEVPVVVLEQKRISVEFAEQGASVFTTFFLALGLFSIGAGILLIFMIFVMLAAERKQEMGMARAVGTKRADLVQTFLSEGMAYNLAAAAVGAGLGVVVAMVIARIMASVFGEFIDISPHVTARSLIISYALGVVLTFITVTFSSWRISNINIVRAVRDIPEPPAEPPQWRARGILATLRRLIFRPGEKRAWVIRPGLAVIAVALMTSVGGIEAGWLQAVVGVAATLLFLSFIFITFQLGPLFLVGSIPLIVVGASEMSQFPLYMGLSLLPIGLALLLRSFGSPERLTYTTAGLVLLYIWLFDFEFNLIESVFGEVDGDIEMFFLSGVMITVASVFLAVYNADLIVTVITMVGSHLGKLMPSIRMAVAYPLVNRSRTGMTMAMFCLVVFSLIVMSSMNYNFEHVFISDRALGGWQVFVDENPSNPIPDLTATLRQSGSSAASRIEAVGTTSLALQRRAAVCEVRPRQDCAAPSDGGETRRAPRGFEDYRVLGQDANFLARSQIPLQTRANGYGSDAEVWEAVRRDPTLAIIDANAISGDFGAPPVITTVDAGARTMEPVEIVVLDRLSGRTARLKVIGVIELGASGTFYFGLHVSEQAFASTFGAPDVRRFYVQTAQGADPRQVARDIESSLLETGAQAESLRAEINRQSSFFTGFFRIIQGFMGLGLFVGVAALGVIAFRSVVERRQQIGMLRALGYTKGMVALTFLLESALIAAGGIATGIIFGLILSRYLIHDEFANQGVVNFVIPYSQVALIGLLSFGSALLMTLLPSRQASSIPIATALRYE